MSMKLSKGDLNRKAAVAGIFFVFMQLFVRGITFLLTPIYTRLVSTSQYGEIRVYESWLLILVPILSLSLYRSVERAKYDFPDTFNEFVSSVQTLSYLVITGVYVVISLFLRKTYMSFCGMDGLMYVYMILYTFSYTSTLYFQRKEKQLLRYKSSVIVTACMMLPATVFSILLLYWGNTTGRQNNLVDLRVIGYYTPQVIGGIFTAILMWKQGNFKIERRYWKYALAFSLPLIPETISIQIMNQADKIMIKGITGSVDTGIFSLATTVSFIIWILEDAVWGAWLPWFYEKIARNEINDVRRPWYFISYVFGYISWILVIFAPEIICILGGKKYQSAMYLVAPMVTGTLFKFYSYCFTAIENYEKKTRNCAIGTVIAMLINIVLNAICINYIGYQSAAYTTAFSYLILLILQGYMEKKVCGMRCVSLARMLVISGMIMGINLITMFTFEKALYIRLGIVAAATTCFFILNRKEIQPLLLIFRKQGKA